MLRRVRDRLIGGAAGAVDRAVTLAVELRSRSGGARVAVSHATRVAFLERLAEEYPAEGALEFLPEPAPIRVTQRSVRSDGARRVLDLTWSSEYAPFLSSYAERYLRTRENHFGIARMFVRDTPRPLIVIIHGYMSGHLAV